MRAQRIQHLAVAGLFILLLFMHTASAQTAARPRSTASASRKQGAEQAFAQAAPKIVFLITQKTGRPHASGSGIILSGDGYIATNYHVIQGADTVETRFLSAPGNSTDYRSFNSVKLLYANAKLDIAILKVNAQSLPFFDCSTTVGCRAHVGEEVYAIGNPKGLSNTISEGIVSALRIIDDEDMIQHTSAISPGSSGGALVDGNGSLLGMNSWQVADGQNLNFAISARHLLDALAAARATSAALAFPDDAPAEVAESEKTSSQPDEPAITTLRTTAEAIKQCPRTIWFESKETKGPLARSRVYFGPPRNVVWDVVHTTSIRSPFMGYIEFTVLRDFWVPPDVYERFKNSDADIYKTFLFQHAPSLKYRYEFDVSPDGLQLTKMLAHSEDETQWKGGASEKACSLAGCSTLCWEAVAQSVQKMAHSAK